MTDDQPSWKRVVTTPDGVQRHFVADGDGRELPTEWQEVEPSRPGGYGMGMAQDTNIPVYDVPHQGPNRAQRRAAAKRQRRATK